MKILMVNKFLYENGGSETYIFQLRDFLVSHGHQVQFFGMADPRNIAGNDWGLEVDNMEFHGRSLQKLLYPFKVIYSREARKKIGTLIERFQPDVAHLNNINFQLTPSILYELKKRGVPIVFTAHDYQPICPNHMLYVPGCGQVCEQCVTRGYLRCTANRCIHGSLSKSLIGSAESMLYHRLGTYKLIDQTICPSRFLEEKLNANPAFQGKTLTLHNFIQDVRAVGAQYQKQEYVLYFGRFSTEKGIDTLTRVCRALPDIPFVFAGGGPLEQRLNELPNVRNMGFQRGKALEKLICEASFSVYPSEWYENCPFSVMESQAYGTPVVGAAIGGIPELIREGETGVLFNSGDEAALRECILSLWNDKARLKRLTDGCAELCFDTVDQYGDKLMRIYSQAN